MNSRKKIYQRTSLLDTTPMTDIVFLLLIFFMLSSSFLIEPGIKLKLPKTKTAEIQAERKLILSITQDNKIYLNDQLIKLEKLEEELRLLIPLEEERFLIIRADAEVKHGLVTEVLDIAKSAGAEKLAIATEKKIKGR
jgi:biopolymer transport protein ExbD